jgi:cytochrome d ubiquinol oxidase subunit II
MADYARFPIIALAPATGLIGGLAAAVTLAKGSRLALIASSLSVAGVVTTAGFGMFPFLLPSSSHPGHCLTVWDASSSQTTLELILVAVAIFLPIVLAYTSWVYWVLRGAVTEAAIENGDDHYY